MESRLCFFNFLCRIVIPYVATIRAIRMIIVLSPTKLKQI